MKPSISRHPFSIRRIRDGVVGNIMDLHACFEVEIHVAMTRKRKNIIQ